MAPTISLSGCRRRSASRRRWSSPIPCGSSGRRTWATGAGSASVSIGGPTGPWWRSSFSRRTAWSSLRQPDGIELLIQIVRRRDRPAADLGAVGHDAVPLQRVEVVHLLVEQSLLEGAQIPLALFGIDGA